MNNINFNDLPSELKSEIFKINKHEEQKQYYKKKYNNCMNELNKIVEELPFYFDISEYIEEDMEDIGDNEICSFILVYQLELKYGCI
tara:strand:+ start:2613 stop:2873 length:261 start_codon:yes stop_codon:yes gene_type:complete